jgi:hypothetical protein
MAVYKKLPMPMFFIADKKPSMALPPGTVMGNRIGLMDQAITPGPIGL